MWRADNFKGYWTLVQAAAIGVALMSSPAVTWAKEGPVDPRADKLLKRTSDYLAQAPFFSFNAEVWSDGYLVTGQRVQAGRTLEVQMRRPNRLHFELRSPRHSRGTFFDGKTFTLFNRVQNLYGTAKVSGSTDEALEFATERLGMLMPLDDLVAGNPYKSVMQNVSSGTYVGPSTVLGVACQHLAFSETNIDWQIWIEDGPRPVPRKIVITYKDEEGSPEFTAFIAGWDFDTKLPDFVFQFEPPPNASKIPIQEVKALKEKEVRP